MDLFRKVFLLLAIVSLLTPSVLSQEKKIHFLEDQIINSTWSMHVWKVLGWQYDSPYWSKGSLENGQIGQKGHIDRDKNVRSVCLGEEGDFYVFFTLRSFIDPTFPNLFIQGVQKPILDQNGNPFSEKDIDNFSFIRYGGLDLVFYENQGGGTFKIKNKISAITHYDKANPQCFGRSRLMKMAPSYFETIDNVKYERPHEKISAQMHLDYKKKSPINIKFVGDHDVALIYIPKSLFGKKVISSLEIANPTLTVRLILEHNKELFGFRFILIGQETVDMIQNYMPTDESKYVSFKGFQKLFTVAGLALGSDTFEMFKQADNALQKFIPDRLVNARNRFELGKIAWEELGVIVKDIAKDNILMAKIRRSMSDKLLSTIIGQQ